MTSINFLLLFCSKENMNLHVFTHQLKREIVAVYVLNKFFN